MQFWNLKLNLELHNNDFEMFIYSQAIFYWHGKKKNPLLKVESDEQQWTQY